MKWILMTLLFRLTNGFFLKFPWLGPKLHIETKECQHKIQYKLPFFEQRLVNKINGFYGMIGPDVNMTSVSSLYELFVGNGNIQGVFFDNGELTFTKHFIRTEKLVYEEENGIIPKNNFIFLLFAGLNKLNLLPNILGLANTAIMNVNRKFYALYERDKPYLINLDFENKKINTIRKINLSSFSYFSAHSKFNEKIETIDYHIFNHSVTYYKMEPNFTTICEKNLPMKYLPVIHDFIVTPDKLIVMDSPLVYDINGLFNKSTPVILDATNHNIIHIMNKTSFEVQQYHMNDSFYLFHYADYKENDSCIELYASVYDELDFSDLNVVGKYRKIIVDKRTKEVFVEKRPYFEELNLDFPIQYNNNVVLRNMENRVINGFVVCDGLTIVKKIIFGNRFICGEPAIHFVNKTPVLISFAFDVSNHYKSYLIIINMNTYKITEIPMGQSVNIGFHSIFVSSVKS